MSVRISQIGNDAKNGICVLSLNRNEHDDDLNAISEVSDFSALLVEIEDGAFVDSDIEQLSREISETHHKRLTVIARPGTTLFSLLWAYRNPKLVRRIVLVEPDELSSWRVAQAAEVVSSVLHRLSIPVLLVVFVDSNKKQKFAAETLHNKLPVSWLRELAGSNALPQLLADVSFKQLLDEFIEIPGKRPQKNIKVGQQR